MDDRLGRDACGRFNFDAAGVAAKDYPMACHAIASDLALGPEDKPVFGTEVMFWKFTRARQAVSRDWDLWMGLLAVAKSTGSEALVKEIAAWFQASPWGEAGNAERP